MKKGISIKAEIIAKLETEMHLREQLGAGNEQMVPGLKAAIAVIDPEYFLATYLKK